MTSADKHDNRFGGPTKSGHRSNYCSKAKNPPICLRYTRAQDYHLIRQQIEPWIILIQKSMRKPIGYRPISTSSRCLFTIVHLLTHARSTKPRPAVPLIDSKLFQSHNPSFRDPRVAASLRRSRLKRLNSVGGR